MLIRRGECGLCAVVGKGRIAQKLYSEDAFH